MRVFLSVLLLLCLGQAASAQSGYRLQPGDSSAISVWQDEKLNRSMIVAPDGTISFPLVGQIKVGGQTVTAVQNILKSRLQSNYADELDITVGLASLGTKAESDLPLFYVTGEVNKPGAFPLDRRGIDALQGIALAGGFGPFAATKRIVINREENGVTYQLRFNYRDLMSGKDPSGNIQLRPGDVVVVPEKGLFGQ